MSQAPAFPNLILEQPQRRRLDPLQRRDRWRAQLSDTRHGVWVRGKQTSETSETIDQPLASGLVSMRLIDRPSRYSMISSSSNALGPPS